MIAASAATLLRERTATAGADVRRMIDAVVAAGFGGLSVRAEHHDWAVADGMTSEQFVALHTERGLVVPAAEVAFLDPGVVDRASVAAAHGRLLDVAARVGARSVIAVVLDPAAPARGGRLDGSDAGLGALCDLAAERGLAVSLEFLPFSALPDLVTAARLVERLDRENLGVVVDAWHWFRQPRGARASDLAALPPDRIHLLQLNDALRRPAADLVADSRDRLLPGDGELDITGLLAALAAVGARPAVVSEVFAPHLLALGPEENARRQYVAARAALGRRPPAGDDR